MNKKKIINDPVYGFISLPFELVFDIIEHPYYQRLRRIQQLGLTHYVYPGALHTRFHHALGAMHLMGQAIKVLRAKGIDISEEEAQAVTIAILLHDIGHGPFSHALEHALVEVHHESLSLMYMNALNEHFNGALSLAIEIFTDRYERRFLHQLVSSQLDMDRMDYLNRDSYFSGVLEGKIGYDRIIKMLNVVDDEIVVEEKGIYSIEKFLIARRIMYWQVYLHKTVLCVEHMLIHSLKRMKKLALSGVDLGVSEYLNFFLSDRIKGVDEKSYEKKLLYNFSKIDDFDVLYGLKTCMKSEDYVLSYLSKSIINRNLFRIELQNFSFDSDYVNQLRLNVCNQLKVTKKDAKKLVFKGSESNSTYNSKKGEIKILLKNGAVKPFSETIEYQIKNKEIKKFFICYPKTNS